MEQNFIEQLQLQSTADGSDSLYWSEKDEHFHSKHGALSESNHVFIKNGLDFFHGNYFNSEINILEVGFGTGLNALLTALYALEKKISVRYHTIDAFPLPEKITQQLNYPDIQKNSLAKDVFDRLHSVSWDRTHELFPDFKLYKQKAHFEAIQLTEQFDVIYYDAFGARVQPELWTESILEKFGKMLNRPGLMVTYAAKGNFKRAAKRLGHKLEKLEGPPGKREMMRSVRD